MNNDYSQLSNVDLEVQVIGACIFNTDIFEYVQDFLHKELFSDYECRCVFDVMMQLVAENKRPDVMEIEARVRRNNINITRFMSDKPDSFDLTKQRIGTLKDLSVRRRLVAVYHKAESMAFDMALDVEDQMAVMKQVDGIMGNASLDDDETVGAAIERLMNDVALRTRDEGCFGMMTGLHLFDCRFGWHTGDLVIIAGETSQGKSTLATTVAYNMACINIPVGYFSMEMSSQQLTARLIARHANMSSSTMLYDKISKDEYTRLYDSTLELKKLPIYFDEKSKTSFQGITSGIRRMVRRHNVKVVFIDYLQILANGSRDNRESIIGDMARDLKRLAVELDVCIVALSQLARGKDNKEPALNRMRGSGQIEEACDMAVLISRQGSKGEKAKLWIAKGRNIGLGVEVVKFNSTLSYFCDFEQGDADKPYEDHEEKLPF